MRTGPDMPEDALKMPRPPGARSYRRYNYFIWCVSRTMVVLTLFVLCCVCFCDMYFTNIFRVLFGYFYCFVVILFFCVIFIILSVLV